MNSASDAPICRGGSVAIICVFANACLQIESELREAKYTVVGGNIWREIQNWLRPERSNQALDSRAPSSESNGIDAAPPASSVSSNPSEGIQTTPSAHLFSYPPPRLVAEPAAGFADLPGYGGGAAVLEDVDACADFPEEELLEFLSADLDPVPADPVFREKLQADLWEMIVERHKDD